MSYVTTKDETRIFYKDWGPENVQPIVFHHGWPLSADDWDTQMLFFLGKGYRVIALDRRGSTTKLPHGMCTSHPDVVNPDLFEFIKGYEMCRFSRLLFDK